MPGMYIRAFCDGVYECLEPYRTNVINLEQNTLQNPHVTLSGILSEVTDFLPLLNTLNSVVNQVCIHSGQTKCIHNFNSMLVI